MPLRAARCRRVQGQERDRGLVLVFGAIFQATGRGFDSLSGATHFPRPPRVPGAKQATHPVPSDDCCMCSFRSPRLRPGAVTLGHREPLRMRRPTRLLAWRRKR